MESLGVQAILDYAAEGAMNLKEAESGYKNLLGACAASMRNAGFFTVKISSICPVPLLERVSQLLAYDLLHPDELHLPWRQETIPVFSSDSEIKCKMIISGYLIVFISLCG